MCSSTLMSSVMYKPRILVEEEKEILHAQTETVVGLETEKDLEDERMRRVFVLSMFMLSLFSSIQIWMSERQVSRWRDRDLELIIIRKRLRLNRVIRNQVRKRFCVEDEENWAQHRTQWHTKGKA